MSRPWPSIRALVAFESAARLGSFSAAARAMNITQGAISHQIRELEKTLDCDLFDREGRSVLLNANGETYLNYTREAMQALRHGAQALESDGVDMTLTVSVSPNFASKWLVPRLGEFLLAQPDIDLRISASMRHIDFSRDDVDLAVRHGTGGWPELDVTRLNDETVFPVISPLLAGASQVSTIEELLQFPLLHDRSRESWDDWANEAGIAVKPSSEGPVFDQTAYVIDAAIAGQGVALARSQLVSLDLAAGRLIAPVQEFVAAPFSYWIVHAPGHPKAALIARFKQWLLSAAALDS